MNSEGIKAVEDVVGVLSRMFLDKTGRFSLTVSTGRKKTFHSRVLRTAISGPHCSRFMTVGITGRGEKNVLYAVNMAFESPLLVRSESATSKRTAKLSEIYNQHTVVTRKKKVLLPLLVDAMG